MNIFKHIQKQREYYGEALNHHSSFYNIQYMGSLISSISTPIPQL